MECTLFYVCKSHATISIPKGHYAVITVGKAPRLVAAFSHKADARRLCIALNKNSVAKAATFVPQEDPHAPKQA
jgi:hypothetical protein